MSVSSSLRDRLDALPLDRAPLRRAGVLTVLLVVLLVLGKVFGPGRPASAATSASRHDVQGATEEVSAPRAAPAWTGGRVLAILLLAAGGGVALVLHRRRPGAASKAETTLDVIETHPLGPGQSLRLVACGAEVLLLSVGTDGARLLRHWPRETFDRTTVSFADALAEAAAGFSAEPDVDAERLPVEPAPVALAPVEPPPVEPPPMEPPPVEPLPAPEPSATFLVETRPSPAIEPTATPFRRGALFPASERSGALRQFRGADA